MIGYRISKAGLETLIENHKPGWLARAQTRTAKFQALGKYEESSSIWSEIKAVYMTLQGESKCVFCERKLESVQEGLIEQDVEHFRPKKNVKKWTTPDDLVADGIVPTDPPGGGGYFLLPYHLFNYAASCKPCNSTLKRDCFPVAGAYDLDGDDPATLMGEDPLLIYPIGDFDDDPEDLITFHGVSPQASAAAGIDRHRALVTIAFFKLDDLFERKNLLRERAMVIVTMFRFLEDLAADPADVVASQVIKNAESAKAPHAGCARAFRRLFQADPVEAEKMFEAALKFVTSAS